MSRHDGVFTNETKLVSLALQVFSPEQISGSKIKLPSVGFDLAISGLLTEHSTQPLRN